MTIGNLVVSKNKKSFKPTLLLKKSGKERDKTEVKDDVLQREEIEGTKENLKEAVVEAGEPENNVKENILQEISIPKVLEQIQEEEEKIENIFNAPENSNDFVPVESQFIPPPVQARDDEERREGEPSQPQTTGNNENPDKEDVEEEITPVRSRKRKQKEKIQNFDEKFKEEEKNLSEEENKSEKPSQMKKKRRTQRRKLEIIDVFSEDLTIAQLCNSNFIVGERLPEREENEESGNNARTTENRRETRPQVSQPARESNSQSQQPASSGPRVRIVNGQIVVDDESLRIQNTAGQDIELLEEEVVNDDDRRINSASFMKKDKAQRWNIMETDLFYEGLSQWGTDFEMITRMFEIKASEPHAIIRTFTRRQIKNKYNKEEKSNPNRVKKALNSKIAVKKDVVNKIRQRNQEVAPNNESSSSSTQSNNAAENTVNQPINEEDDTKDNEEEQEIVEEYVEDGSANLGFSAEELAAILNE